MLGSVAVALEVLPLAVHRMVVAVAVLRGFVQHLDHEENTGCWLVDSASAGAALAAVALAAEDENWAS